MVIKKQYSLCPKSEQVQPLTQILLLKPITMGQYQRTLMQKTKMNLKLIKRIIVIKVPKSKTLKTIVSWINCPPGHGIITTLITKKSLLWSGHLLRTNNLQ